MASSSNAEIIPNTFITLDALFGLFSTDTMITALEMLSAIADLEVFMDHIDTMLESSTVREIAIDMTDTIAKGLMSNDDDIRMSLLDDVIDNA